jgi:hypothetical protein
MEQRRYCDGRGASMGWGCTIILARCRTQAAVWEQAPVTPIGNQPVDRAYRRRDLVFEEGGRCPLALTLASGPRISTEERKCEWGCKDLSTRKRGRQMGRHTSHLIPPPFLTRNLANLHSYQREQD